MKNKSAQKLVAERWKKTTPEQRQDVIKALNKARADKRLDKNDIPKPNK